jgi:hypothetical protein
VRAAGAILCVAAIIATAVLFVQTSPRTGSPGALTGHEFVYAILALLLFYGICMSVSGTLNPVRLAIGADGNLSASKFQFLVWNAAVVFSYVWIYAVRYSLHAADDLAAVGPISIPYNVLYVMGFSIGTFAAAKAITVSYINAGRLSDDSVAPPGAPSQSGAPPNGAARNTAPAGGLATTDGAPDLSKIQMLVWTLIAVAIFLVETFHNVFGTNQAAVACSTLVVNSAQPCLPLPDIDPVLMILMGLGQAAYLGTKLTLSDAPVLSALIVGPGATANAPRQVRLTGKSLKGSVMVLFGTVAEETDLSNASDTDVTVPLPGSVAGLHVDVSVIVDGVRSANSLPLSA